MEKAKALDILKKAILMEMKGKAFYESVAAKTDNEGIRKVFEIMAVEESSHVDILGKQFKSLSRSGKFEPLVLEDEPQDYTEQILTGEIRKQISASGFEAAAISAAMAMEESAIKFYAERAENAPEPMEKDMFRWLSDWEKTHLNLLASLDRELQEEVWNDQGFWPF